MKIVSFSGIDGAGKSTQISELQIWLEQSKLNTKILTFWDDVVVLARSREFMSYKAFKGDCGVGSPEKPLNRRDKNVTSPLLTTMRFCLYLADAMNLRSKVREARKSGADVVIFDRYIYDELANLPLTRRSARIFSRFVLKIIPTPEVAYVIDADPTAAHARKPEYPLEFVRRNREAYITLAELSGDLTVIQHSSVDEMKVAIQNKMLQTFAPLDSDPGDRNSSYSHLLESQHLPR